MNYDFFKGELRQEVTFFFSPEALWTSSGLRDKSTIPSTLAMSKTKALTTEPTSKLAPPAENKKNVSIQAMNYREETVYELTLLMCQKSNNVTMTFEANYSTQFFYLLNLTLNQAANSKILHPVHIKIFNIWYLHPSYLWHKMGIQINFWCKQTL